MDFFYVVRRVSSGRLESRACEVRSVSASMLLLRRVPVRAASTVGSKYEEERNRRGIGGAALQIH